MGWTKETTHSGKRLSKDSIFPLKLKELSLSAIVRSRRCATALAALSAISLFIVSAPMVATALETQFASVYPIVGTRLSSKFGMRNHPVIKKRRHHHGIDLAAPKNAHVRSIQSGTVVFADKRGGYGNLIVILHDNGLTSHYGHLNKISTETGSRVKAGELIGLVGSTGRVTGPHLHFEVRKNGKPLDPLKLFPNIAKRGQG